MHLGAYNYTAEAHITRFQKLKRIKPIREKGRHWNIFHASPSSNEEDSGDDEIYAKNKPSLFTMFEFEYTKPDFGDIKNKKKFGKTSSEDVEPLTER